MDAVTAFATRLGAIDLEHPGLSGDLVVAATLFWCLFFPVFIYALKILLALFCSSMPDAFARIPTKFPHADPAGGTKTLPQAVATATDAQKKAFRTYMKEHASEFPLADPAGDR
jgi:hypothetical protein